MLSSRIKTLKIRSPSDDDLDVTRAHWAILVVTMVTSRLIRTAHYSKYNLDTTFSIALYGEEYGRRYDTDRIADVKHRKGLTARAK